MSRRFAEEALEETLGAVRARRERKAWATRVSLAAALLFAVGLVSRSGRDRAAEVAGLPAPVREVTEPEAVHRPPTIAVFTTEQVSPKVNRIDDAKLAELLAGRSHGLIATADGRRRLWVPDS